VAKPVAAAVTVLDHVPAANQRGQQAVDGAQPQPGLPGELGDAHLVAGGDALKEGKGALDGVHAVCGVGLDDGFHHVEKYHLTGRPFTDR